MPVQIKTLSAQLPVPAARLEHAYSRALLMYLRRTGQARAELDWAGRELEALAREVGIEPVCSLVQTRNRIDQQALLGRGALTSLQTLLRDASQRRPDDQGPVILLVDAVLTPQQHRELAAALDVDVIDRTQLILRLFALRARTQEAKLTVEIARARHELPRLREDRSKLGREGGGGRGERGNTQLALSKERCRARIAALERELTRVQHTTAGQRARRSELKRVAIVGYTNAGKSSWLHALTGTETLIADKPFATLGTSVRKLQRRSAAPEPILVCDTVGFVRELPHELVPSFQATLDEAREADLALCVVDASDPHFREQLEVLENTLDRLGVLMAPRQILLNKLDRVDAVTRRRLAGEFPHALRTSAHNAADVARVRKYIADQFEVPE